MNVPNHPREQEAARVARNTVNFNQPRRDIARQLIELAMGCGEKQVHLSPPGTARHADYYIKYENEHLIFVCEGDWNITWMREVDDYAIDAICRVIARWSKDGR